MFVLHRNGLIPYGFFVCLAFLAQHGHFEIHPAVLGISHLSLLTAARWFPAWIYCRVGIHCLDEEAASDLLEPCGHASIFLG